MNKHHPFGGSRLGLRSDCPGSYAMEEEAVRRDMVLEEYAEDAREGSDLHALLPRHFGLLKLEDEPRMAVEKARAWIAAVTEGASSVLYEVPLELWLDGELLLFGTADVVALFPDRPHLILDIKFGRVEADKGAIVWQLLAYGCAYGLSRRPRNGVQLRAFQSRLGIEWGGAEYTISQLEKEAFSIKGVIDRSMLSPKALFKGPWCRLCRGKSICPEWQTELAMVPKKEFLPENVEQLERLVLLCSMVDQVGPAARNKLKELILAGAESTMYEVRSKRHDTPKDVETVFALLDGVISQEEFLRCCKVELGPLKKALKAVGGGIAGCVTEGTITYLRKKGSTE